MFFTIHDPTTLNRLGADVGIWHAPIVTQVTPLETFYPAESYHQNYFEQNPYQPYSQIVIAPKVAKVRHQYLARLKRAYRVPCSLAHPHAYWH